MSCFNCNKAVPKICKGDCCGIVPIPKVVFEICKDKIVEQPIKMGQWELIDNEVVLPITKSGSCAFLRKILNVTYIIIAQRFVNILD